MASEAWQMSKRISKQFLHSGIYFSSWLFLLNVLNVSNVSRLSLMWSRTVCFSPNNSTLLSYTEDLFLDISFPMLINSCNVVCSPNPHPSNIFIQKLSTFILTIPATIPSGNWSNSPFPDRIYVEKFLKNVIASDKELFTVNGVGLSSDFNWFSSWCSRVFLWDFKMSSIFLKVSRFSSLMLSTSVVNSLIFPVCWTHSNLQSSLLDLPWFCCMLGQFLVQFLWLKDHSPQSDGIA